jgi:hypothetical protein
LLQIMAALERRGATRRRYCRSSIANVRRSRGVGPASGKIRPDAPHVGDDDDQNRDSNRAN